MKGKKLTIVAVLSAIALFLADDQTAAILVGAGMSAAASAKAVGVGKLVAALMAAMGEKVFGSKDES